MKNFVNSACLLLCLLGLIEALPFWSNDIDIDDRGLLAQRGVKYVGDACTTSNGKKGKCTIDRKCPMMIELLSERKNSKKLFFKPIEIKVCGFSNKQQVVCCPQQPTILNQSKLKCEGTRPRRDTPQMGPLIAGGEDADNAEFPHMAALAYRDNVSKGYKFGCGGALISKDFVLTAAHCVNQNDRPYFVRLGKTSLNDDSDNEEGQDIKISKFIIHKNYSSISKQNDIALLKLQRPAQLRFNVWPACLSSGTNGLMKDLTIIGFGDKSYGALETSNWLSKATVHEVQLETCQESYKDERQIISSQVCAQDPNRLKRVSGDACQGDSGGPMTYKKNDRFHVYGIISYGRSCGFSFPAVYTRVDQYLDWINEKMF